MIGSHRDNAQFSRARWRKTILLPCWITQVVLLLGLMGLFSYRLAHTVNTWKDAEDAGDMPAIEVVWEAVNISFSLISLVITLVSIARFIAEAMTPLPLLFGCILNLVLSGAVLALDIVVYIQRADKKYSLVGLGLDCVLMAFTIIPLVYAVVVYRRLLAYDDYHLPGNHRPYGYGGNEEVAEDLAFDSTYDSAYLQPTTPYDPTNPSTAAATRPRSLSGPRRISLTFSRGTSPSPIPSPPAQPRSRPGSYDHRRDTSFDDYVSRRRSSSTVLHDDVKRALGAEFGWGDVDRDKRESGISARTVAVAHCPTARTRGNSLLRQTSLEAKMSLTADGSGSSAVAPSITVHTPDSASTMNGGGAPGPVMRQRGHSLVSVPEHEEESSQGVKADGETLLGKEIQASGSSSVGNGKLAQVEGLEDIELESRKRRRADS
ncbi:hypothetical protein F5Y15DRAFT_410357 [Xylariaceae sp. FL0016]|nr:hypothetical protein F5Y15DRAFT_410357 [Xylariaceae sp. FL0016]